MALQSLNAALQLDPKDVQAYILRGNLYAGDRRLDLAEADYEKALVLDPGNTPAQLNISELKFREKQYDLARSGFEALKSNKDHGDLAAYMVFLCDLFGSHEDAAQQELNAFNSVGENPSYYFSNVAWDIFHKDNTGAQEFLQSALNIYSPSKVSLYSSNLLELGYLPLRKS